MRRLFIVGILFVALLAPLAISQQPDIYIGMVTYKVNAQVWDIQNYARPMNGDLQVLPLGEGVSREIPDVEPQHYLVEIREASTAADQIAAMNELIDFGVHGMVLTPVAEVDLIRDAVSAIAADMPFTLTTREITGINAPYFGFDTYDLGITLTDYDGVKPYVFIGNLDDKWQSDFLAGLIEGTRLAPTTYPDEEIVDQLQGYYSVKSSAEAYTEALAALAVFPDLFGILTFPEYVPGIQQAIAEVYAGTDTLIKVGSIGAPEGWKEMFDNSTLHTVFGWDNYLVLQRAAVGVKVMLRDGETPEDFYPDGLYITSSTSTPSRLSYPYSEDQPNRAARWWR